MLYQVYDKGQQHDSYVVYLNALLISINYSENFGQD